MSGNESQLKNELYNIIIKKWVTITKNNHNLKELYDRTILSYQCI